MTTFLAPDGPLPARPLETSAGDGAVRLLVELDGAAWQRVRAGSLFHMGGLSLPPGLRDDVACRLLLRLADEPAAAVLRAGDGAHGALLDGLPDALRDQSHWYLEDVQRDVEVPPGLDGPGIRLVEGASAGPRAPSGPSGSLLAVLERWLADQDQTPQRLDGADALRLDGTGENGAWVLWLEAREEQGVVLVFSSWPEAVPPDRLPAVMEMVTRINPDLPVGAFELDLDRGQLSLRSSIDVSRSELTDGLLERLVAGSIETFDRYLPVLLDVLDGHHPQTRLAREAG